MRPLPRRSPRQHLTAAFVQELLSPKVFVKNFIFLYEDFVKFILINLTSKRLSKRFGFRTHNKSAVRQFRCGFIGQHAVGAEKQFFKLF